MSSPVVTVPPELPLKELADVLVERAISAVPVVEGGELVGIVSEADLLPWSPPPTRAPISRRSPSHPPASRRWWPR